MKVKVKVVQPCLTLCGPMDYRVHGILQARIMKWVAFSFSRGSSKPRDWTQVSHIAGRFFTSWATREVMIRYYYSLLALIGHSLLIRMKNFPEKLSWQSLDNNNCYINIKFHCRPNLFTQIQTQKPPATVFTSISYRKNGIIMPRMNLSSLQNHSVTLNFHFY